MTKSSFCAGAAILLVLVGMLAPAVSAEEAKLAYRCAETDEHGARVFHFELTAPSDRTVFYIVDKETEIVLHQAETKQNGAWKKIGSPWCARPEYRQLLSGKSTKFQVTAPETRQPWRISLTLYDRKPAPEVRTTEVRSDAVR